MIAALIRWSIVNRFLVLLATLGVVAWGLWAVQRTPLWLTTITLAGRRQLTWPV